MATTPSHELYDSLRAEYKEASMYSIHLTELNWQVGSILVGGSLAAVALSLSSKQTKPTILVTLKDFEKIRISRH